MNKLLKNLLQAVGRIGTLSVLTLLALLCLPLLSRADSIPDSIPTKDSAVDVVSDSIPGKASVVDSIPRKVVRKVTPVDIDPDKPRQPTLHYYDKHGNPLPEPVMFLTETDTVSTPSPRSPYPLYDGINIGLNFFDAILRIAGQTHSSFDLWANVSLHNWFFPTVEVGVGFGNNKPEDGNFNYKAKLSPYFKIGLDYNFLYKSNPDYQAFIGLRAGVSTYRYDITDITVSSGYWQQTGKYEILNQRATSLYGEALAGLRVKIWKCLSMGWTIRYHFPFHTKLPEPLGGSKPGSDPWFIPGYGAGSPLSFTFSLIFNLPGHKRELPASAQ